MQAIWKYTSYQDLMKDYRQSLPNNGRGFSVKMAKALDVHPTLLSQILQGHRDLTFEQAALFCEYAGLTEKESDIFIKLVEIRRAGNESLRKILRRHLAEMKKEYEEVRAHIPTSAKELSEEEKSIFYSSWHYSAFRMMCSLDSGLSTDEIASRLNMTRERANTVETFLLKTALIKRKGDRFVLGTQNTHVGADSYWVVRHHQNWRTRNLNKLEHISEEELCFTAPFSCSAKDFKQIKENILQVIKETSTIVKETDPENVYTLCIDLTRV